jgi:competence protein ComEC
MLFFRLGIPFVRFLIVFSIGILSGEYACTPSPVWELCVAWGVVLVLFFIRKKIPYSFLIVGSYLLLFYAGNQVVASYYDHHDPMHYIHAKNSTDYYVARIAGEPRAKKNRLCVVLEVQSIRETERIGWRAASGKLLAYLPLADTALVQWGDRLLVQGAASVWKEPINPGQFDYAAYLRRKNIVATHFIRAGRYCVWDRQEANGIFALAASFRKKCEAILKKGILAPDEYQIAVALILGAQTELDEQLYQAYSDSGTIHALAVSGMHVSLVYLVITYGLGFVKRFRAGKKLFPIIALCLLWFYAMVTGFSPSVVRAVTMFSVFIVAGVFRRQANTYNALAFSAFVILCVQPLWLLDIGFQFSFMAVLGIVGIHPVLHRSFTPKAYLTKSIWSLVSVSLAAQAAVAPLSIYYFHSFPLLFLVYNLLVVPISSLALYTGLAALVFYKLDFVAQLSTSLTYYLLRAMNEIVCFPVPEFLQKKEYLYLSRLEVVLLYAVLFVAVYAIQCKSYRWFCVMVVFVGLYTGSAIYNDYQTSRQYALTVYYTKRQAVVSLIEKDHALVLSDSLLHPTDKTFRYAVYNHLVSVGVKKVHFATFKNPSNLVLHTDSYGTLLVWQQKKIVRRNKKVKVVPHWQKEADVVLEQLPQEPYTFHWEK